MNASNWKPGDPGPAVRFLCLAARGHRDPEEDAELVDLFQSLGEGRVRVAAKTNSVELLAASAIVDVCGWSALSDEWRTRLLENERRVDHELESVAAICDTLRQRDCHAAAIEGAGTLLAGGIPTRAYGASDFDLLVDEAKWEIVEPTMTQLGYERANRGRSTKRVEFRRQHNARTEWVEVGFQPFDRVWVPLRYFDRSSVWLTRLVASAKVPEIRVLRPTDALALTCMHASVHSYARSPSLRLYVDIDRSARDANVDWSQFGAELRAMQISRRAFVALMISQALLATPVPDSLLEQLNPGWLRSAALQRVVEQVRVVAEKPRHLPFMTAIALDALIDERSPMGWAWGAAVPPAEWLRERFDARGLGTLGLHIDRVRAFGKRWTGDVT